MTIDAELVEPWLVVEVADPPMVGVTAPEVEAVAVLLGAVVGAGVGGQLLSAATGPKAGVEIPPVALGLTTKPILTGRVREAAMNPVTYVKKAEPLLGSVELALTLYPIEVENPVAQTLVQVS